MSRIFQGNIHTAGDLTFHLAGKLSGVPRTKVQLAELVMEENARKVPADFETKFEDMDMRKHQLEVVEAFADRIRLYSGLGKTLGFCALPGVDNLQCEFHEVRGVPVRWMRAYDVRTNLWLIRADVAFKIMQGS